MLTCSICAGVLLAVIAVARQAQGIAVQSQICLLQPWLYTEQTVTASIKSTCLLLIIVVCLPDWRQQMYHLTQYHLKQQSNPMW